jgi:hypothetical protein
MRTSRNTSKQPPAVSKAGRFIPDDTLLPRYVFTETGVGCEQHSDPTCLCDVELDAVGVTDVVATDITFGALALQVIGTDLNEKNFVEFASLVLGMADAEAVLVDPTEAEMLAQGITPGNKHKGQGSPWSELDDTVRDKMRAAWSNSMPWSQAKLFLPETLNAEERRYIMKYYNQRQYAKRTTKAGSK